MRWAVVLCVLMAASPWTGDRHPPGQDASTTDRALRVVELLDEILAEIHQAERLRWVHVVKQVRAIRELVVELGRPARGLPRLVRVYEALATEAHDLEAASKLED